MGKSILPEGMAGPPGLPGKPLDELPLDRFRSLYACLSWYVGTCLFSLR